jgi:hypothetical protein
MDELLAALHLGAIKFLLFWRTINSISGFYMQRLHYERPDMTGSVIPGPPLLSLAANLMSWVTHLAAVYVWYRLGWVAALAYLIIPFVIAQVIEMAELFLFKVPTPTMALINTPIGIASFVMVVLALIEL